MIEYLKIKQFAILHDAEISFSSKSNIITGETGSGKSLIIKAIKIITGDKIYKEIDSDYEINCLFKITDEQKELLKEFEIDLENSEVIVRVIKKGSSVKFFLNDSLISISILKKITEYLILICGQNETTRVLDPNYQLFILDSFSKTKQLNAQLNKIYYEIIGIEKKINELKIIELSKEDKISFINYQLKQYEDYKIDPDDEKNSLEYQRAYEKEKNELKNYSFFNNVMDNNDIISHLTKMSNEYKKHNLENVELIEGILENIEKVYFFNQKKIKEIEKKNNDDEYDYIEKIQQINNIKKKFGSLEIFFNKKEELNKEIKKIEEISDDIKYLEKSLEKLKKDWHKLAQELSKKRNESKKNLEKLLDFELKSLDMNDAIIEIQNVISSDIKKDGVDQISFLINTNRGYEKKILSKIASGGELSRITLAILNIINRYELTPTIIFDEIDVGIGGNTGYNIGKKIKEISESKQVICISHLAQVALYADRHIYVEKQNYNNTTQTIVQNIEGNEKDNELKRMLGGESLSEMKLKTNK